MAANRDKDTFNSIISLLPMVHPLVRALYQAGQGRPSGAALWGASWQG